MDWNAIGAIGEIVGAVAVFVTLVYLSIQVREGNKRAELEGFRHTLDGFNGWSDQVVSSKDTASLLRRGRQDMSQLDEDERIQFELLHVRLLNTVEGWYRGVDQTARDDEYRAAQVVNLEAVVQFFFGHPGAREVWDTHRAGFPLVADVIDRSLEAMEDG